jgi:hypothetical protein
VYAGVLPHFAAYGVADSDGEGAGVSRAVYGVVPGSAGWGDDDQASDRELVIA